MDSYLVTYLSTHKPDSELVEADECTLDGTWFVFKRYLVGSGLTPVLRIKSEAVERIELPDIIQSAARGAPAVQGTPAVQAPAVQGSPAAQDKPEHLS